MRSTFETPHWSLYDLSQSLNTLCHLWGLPTSQGGWSLPVTRRLEDDSQLAPNSPLTKGLCTLLRKKGSNRGMLTDHPLVQVAILGIMFRSALIGAPE